MNFDLEENHRMIRDLVRDFAAREVAPGAMKRDETCEFPFDLCQKLGELGLMGIMVPEALGGAGLDVTSFVIAVEEIARHDGSLALTAASHNGLCIGHMLVGANDTLKKKYLPSLASGKKLGAWCLTEPGSGSDALAMKTTAVKKGDRWVINGSKNFITQGSVGDVYVILAHTDRSKGTRGVTAFIAEKGWKGLTPGKKEEKLGVRSSDTAALTFENLEIPEENVLGNVGEGFINALKVLDRGRVVIGAMALGLGRGALEEAAKYSKERQAFGHPISEFQGIQWLLADSAMELEAARVLVYRAAWLQGNGKFSKKESSMAKLYASEAAMRACHRGIQVFGGYGYVKEYPVERYFRDVKLCEIGEGTSEIQRDVIANQVIDQASV
ncbi:MAG TPA: acyl-CoA dehydrogenase family protein [Bdellovibrionota bacterium]|nr:acyl-CoA dehydrogenase family protein [Bdellovibrionota bacterium]